MQRTSAQPLKKSSAQPYAMNVMVKGEPVQSTTSSLVKLQSIKENSTHTNNCIATVATEIDEVKRIDMENFDQLLITIMKGERYAKSN